MGHLLKPLSAASVHEKAITLRRRSHLAIPSTRGWTKNIGLDVSIIGKQGDRMTLLACLGQVKLQTQSVVARARAQIHFSLLFARDLYCAERVSEPNGRTSEREVITDYRLGKERMSCAGSVVLSC